MKLKHILYLGWGNHIHLRRWAGYFAKAGYKVTILSMSSNAAPLDNIRIIPLYCRRKRTSFLQMEIGFWLWNLRPNICHIHWAGFGPLLKKQNTCPVGITVWGSDIYNLGQNQPEDQKDIIESLQRAKFVTCDSNDLKIKIQAHINQDSETHIIQWGVDANLFKPGLNSSVWKKELGINSGCKVILSIRNINPIYQPETIIDAFAAFVKIHPEFVLIQKHYMSSSKRLADLKQYAYLKGIHDKIIWLGDIPYEKLPLLYNMADMVVSVPNSDGTPMSLLETMACGKVPIVSDLPSIREWVTDKKNGFIVPVADSAALLRAFSAKLNNKELCLKIVNNNLKVVLEKASTNAHMHEMLSIYKGVLG